MKNTTESTEMYLETILVITKRKGTVRAIDIAREMNFSKPTISQQTKRLRDRGLIEISDTGNITLTEEGFRIGNMILERHDELSKIFEYIGVSHETAIDDACRVEHYISKETFQKLKDYFDPIIKQES